MPPVNPYYILFTVLGMVFTSGVAWGALGGRLRSLENEQLITRAALAKDRAEIVDLQRFESRVDERLSGIEKGVAGIHSLMVSNGQKAA